MKRKYNRATNIGFEPIEVFEGTTIEHKIQRMMENNEPITETTGIHFTEKKDGVRPEFNIRTDKWEIAQKTMDAVNKAKIAKGNMSPIEQNNNENNNGGENNSPSEQS